MAERPAAAGHVGLAICPPTRHRGDLLARSLAELIAKARRNRILIYVSDNDASDATASVAALAADYESLRYSRTDAPPTADENLRRALGLPDAEYRCLFGDRYRIADDEALQQWLASLDEGFDVIVLDSPESIRNPPTQNFTVTDRALEKMDLERFRGTNLLQTLAIFEHLDCVDFRLRWPSDPVIEGFRPPLPENRWTTRALKLFVRDWFVGIMSRPPGHSLNAKRRALRAHIENTSLFSSNGLRRLRSVGAIDATMARRHARELLDVFDARRMVYLLVCATLPVRLLWALRQRPERA